MNGGSTLGTGLATISDRPVFVQIKAGVNSILQAPLS